MHLKIGGGEQAIFMVVRNIGLWKDLQAYNRRDEISGERYRVRERRMGLLLQGSRRGTAA